MPPQCHCRRTAAKRRAREHFEVEIPQGLREHLMYGEDELAAVGMALRLVGITDNGPCYVASHLVHSA